MRNLGWGKKTLGKKLWNSCKKIGPAERLGSHMGKFLTIEYYEAKRYFAFDETNESENTQFFMHVLHIAFDAIACWMCTHDNCAGGI